MTCTSDLESAAATWWRQERSWVGDPDQVMRELPDEGFQEYKRETAKGGQAHADRGGIWQGLHPRTGAVATVIWVSRPTPSEARVFIEIDGRSIEGSPPRCLSDGGRVF
jgi:hypothetical protein